MFETIEKKENIKEYTPQQIRFKEPVDISTTELAYPDTLYVYRNPCLL